MAYKYLLSNGYSTDKIEEYILDVIGLYLSIHPGDIPHSKNLGFNFTITDTMKDGLEEEIVYRVDSLIDTIKSRLSGVSIAKESISLIDETKVKLVLRINGKLSDEYYINLYE